MGGINKNRESINTASIHLVYMRAVKYIYIDILFFYIFNDIVFVLKFFWLNETHTPPYNFDFFYEPLHSNNMHIHTYIFFINTKTKTNMYVNRYVYMYVYDYIERNARK